LNPGGEKDTPILLLAVIVAGLYRIAHCGVDAIIVIEAIGIGWNS